MLCRSIDLDEDGGISGTTFCAALCCYSQKVIEAGVAFDVGLCGLAKADMTCQHGQQHAGEQAWSANTQHGAAGEIPGGSPSCHHHRDKGMQLNTQ